MCTIFCGPLSFSWALVLAALAVAAEPVRAQTRVTVVVIGRVVDRADSVSLAGVIVTLDSLRYDVARTDSAGRFVLRGTLPRGAVTLSAHNGFYRPIHRPLVITAGGAVDLGLLLLERGPEPLEYMVSPWCERVSRRPRRLAGGMWLEPAPDSAGRRTWLLCDGLLREPRVPAAASPSRPAA